MMQLQHVFLTYFEPGPKSIFCLHKKKRKEEAVVDVSAGKLRIADISRLRLRKT